MATKKRKKRTAPTSKPRKRQHTMLVMDGEELRAALAHAQRDDVIECAAGTYVLDGAPLKIPPGVQLTVAQQKTSGPTKTDLGAALNAERALRESVEDENTSLRKLLGQASTKVRMFIQYEGHKESCPYVRSARAACDCGQGPWLRSIDAALNAAPPSRAAAERAAKEPETNVDVQVTVDAVIADPFEKFEKFRREWAKLPPLVRANIASGLAERMGAIVDGDDRRIAFHQRLRLGRRAEVIRRFQQGCGFVQLLFAALCLEADDDAVKRGIDLDVHPDPDTQFALGT